MFEKVDLFTNHGLMRAIEREIDEEQIELVIHLGSQRSNDNGTWTYSMDSDGVDRAYQAGCSLELVAQIRRVVVVTTGRDGAVITVYKDQGNRLGKYTRSTMRQRSKRNAIGRGARRAMKQELTDTRRELVLSRSGE